MQGAAEVGEDAGGVVVGVSPRNGINNTLRDPDLRRGQSFPALSWPLRLAHKYACVGPGKYRPLLTVAAHNVFSLLKVEVRMESQPPT
jgi:hypothetical protein